MKPLTDAELLNIIMNDPFHIEWAKQQPKAKAPKSRKKAKRAT